MPGRLDDKGVSVDKRDKQRGRFLCTHVTHRLIDKYTQYTRLRDCETRSTAGRSQSPRREIEFRSEGRGRASRELIRRERVSLKGRKKRTKRSTGPRDSAWPIIFMREGRKLRRAAYQRRSDARGGSRHARVFFSTRGLKVSVP